MTASPPATGYSGLIERLRNELRTLPDKPDESPEATLACLWALAKGTRISISQSGGFEPGPLDDREESRLRDFVEQRLSGVPLAHLTGRQDFMNLVMLASPAALVPRKETEQLGYSSVRLLSRSPAASPLVLDICTGAGNVALGIAMHAPTAHVLGADISEEAIVLARRNAVHLERPDVEFRRGDLLEPFRETEFLGEVDLITCNPPYISSARVDSMPEEISAHEPRLAFDGGPFGIGLIRRLIKDAPDFLKRGGWLVFEVGAGQGEGVVRSLERDAHFGRIDTRCDAGGEIRVIEGRRTEDQGDDS